MKDQFISLGEYKRRLKLVLRSKLNGKNKISAINTWAVAVIRYGAGIIGWSKGGVKGGRGLISCESCIK